MRTLNSSNGLSANSYSSSAHDNLETAKSVAMSTTHSVENETFTDQRPFDSQPDQRTAIGANESATKKMNSVSRTLLCYPIAYLCLIMPISIARIAEFTGAGVPIPVVFFACGFYASSGYVNVIVYTTTRKGIISWSWITGLIGRKRNAEWRYPFAAWQIFFVRACWLDPHEQGEYVFNKHFQPVKISK